MAPPSPRRSSRARVPNSQSQQSSMSSGTSGRLERSTRLLNKPSSDKSTPTASLSSEPPEDMDDTLLGRRRRRAQEDDFERASRADHSDMANGSDDLQEDDEDEAVRCICGSEDYPGRPLVDGPDAEFFDAVELTEEVTGFFVQCDICKVWQHGACVGIFSAESSPEEYFCEQCRKDLHKIFFANDGQKYSKYVPLYRTSRASSTAASATKDDGGSSRPSSKHSKGDMNHPSKRRSTMNSRDAAYDDEQLRRAIEASKENIGESEDGSGRPAKRGRSDSEENQTIVKRQRTGSRSPSPAVNSALPESREGSDDEMTTRSATRKSRNARSLRERSEKEERERQRQESALKRRGRAERRRAEDSDISEETPVLVPKQPQPTQQSAEIPTTTTDQAAPAAPPGTPPPAQPSTSNPQKRAVKSTQKRGKGRNQYTKDRDGDQDESPARSMSRDIQKPDDTSSATHLKSPVPQEPKQTSKVKSSATNKMTMLDMKRRVTAIMDFISRTQIDLAAEGGQSSSSDSGTSTPGKAAEVLQENGLLQIQQAEGALGEAVLGAIDGKDFKELNCMEMMDVLTRDMVKWQNQYA